MKQHLQDRVAIVTGGGRGLGRSHALHLASQGAKVVVNDLGSQVDGQEADHEVANETVEMIRQKGGHALAHFGSITSENDCQTMVEQALKQWGRIDILVNNAGILKDTTFKKQTSSDWHDVLNVHLTGTRNATKACWEHFRQAQFGRIIITTSASGLYGNFGQSNYGAAKMGLIGLMNCLKEEGKSGNIFINAIAPMAKTRMTEGLLPDEMLGQLDPQWVSPVVSFFANPQCQITGEIWSVGAGVIARNVMIECEPVQLRNNLSVDSLIEHQKEISQLRNIKTHENLMSEAATLLSK